MILGEGHCLICKREISSDFNFCDKCLLRRFPKFQRGLISYRLSNVWTYDGKRLSESFVPSFIIRHRDGTERWLPIARLETIGGFNVSHDDFVGLDFIILDMTSPTCD